MAQQCMHSFMHPPAVHRLDCDLLRGTAPTFIHRIGEGMVVLPQSLQGSKVSIICCQIPQVQSGGDSITVSSARVSELETELQIAEENLTKVQWIWVLSIFDRSHRCAWWQVEKVKLSEIDPWLQMVMIYQDVVSLCNSHKKRLWKCSRPLQTTLCCVFDHFGLLKWNNYLLSWKDVLLNDRFEFEDMIIT